MPTQNAQLHAIDIQRWLAHFLETFFEERDRLSDLDRAAGDGDFGSNLTPPFQAAQTSLAESTPSATAEGVRELFSHMTTPLWRTGGTSGPLLAVWFQAWGDILGQNDTVDVASLSAALVTANAATVGIGSAEEGDKTMVDAMLPAERALQLAVDRSMSLEEALSLAAEASRDGAARTANLVARKGRSSYLGTRATGVLDPGAVLISIFFASAPLVASRTPLSNT